jgi:hypothetical protein
VRRKGLDICAAVLAAAHAARSLKGTPFTIRYPPAAQVEHQIEMARTSLQSMPSMSADKWRCKVCQAASGVCPGQGFSYLEPGLQNINSRTTLR